MASQKNKRQSKTNNKPRGNFKRATKDNPTRTIRTPENREKILENITSGKATTLTLAAEMAGVGRNSAYDWMKAEPKFKEAVDAAFAGPGKDALKAVLMDHALHGIQKPVIFQGEMQYVMKAVKKVKTTKTGAKKSYLAMEPALDKKGQPIPLTITEWDHALQMRMLDRMDPKLTGNLGDELIDLAEELKEARARAGVEG